MRFSKLRTVPVPSMQAEVQEYEDTVSGARHIHLASDDNELIFLVAFPTLPMASDGRAHILEHLALCGSARYSVRDPFFSMLRRSVAHFMNAMTYSDKTVYPFATTDKTDFFNLMDVYLDAAFFPHLDYLDFRQEGWRLSLDGEQLAYQGVVFNEMKGAFSSPQRTIDAGISAVLFDGTTYAYESGGDPLEIPQLTHEELKAFHAEHYHPSQAVFMTCGRIDPKEVQDVLYERVLSKLDGRKPRKRPELAPTWPAPRAVTINAPTTEYSMQFAWLMGNSGDPLVYYQSQLLDAGLLSNASAPLTYAMESAGYGRPSPFNGTDPSRRQIVFHLGMEGLNDTQLGKARDCIWRALEKTAVEGVEPAVLQATLRDIRFSLQDVRDGQTPHVLRRLLRALPYEFYGGDIMSGFASDEVLAQLQEKVADPDFFKSMVQSLLDSTTRVDATVVPDAAYFQNRQKIEEERVSALQASLSDEERQRIRSESQALLERQRRIVDNSVLPRIRPQDVDPQGRAFMALPEPKNGIIAAQLATNGVSHARVLYDVSHFTEEDWPWLQLYVEVLPDLGMGEMSYEDADAWRHDIVPFFDVDLQTLSVQDAPDVLRIHVDFYAKGLRDEHQGIAEVLSKSIQSARFDEHARLAFLIDSNVQDIRNALADEGDSYARSAATAPLSASRKFDEWVNGAASLRFYADLHRQSRTEEGIAAIAKRLEDLHRRIICAKSTLITAGLEQDSQTLAELIRLPEASAESLPPARVQELALAKSALHAPTQVNHCFAAWRAPGMAHPHAPALAVLGELVTNLVLHQAVREEGGAYGGQAGYSPYAGTFVMMSYRDPRLGATYADFERAAAWVLDTDLQKEHIEEAIICVIQSLDKPRPPFAELMWLWSQAQQGVSLEMFRQYREGVLRCTAEDIKAAAAAWLREKPYSQAAFVGNREQELAGLEMMDLTALAT